MRVLIFKNKRLLLYFLVHSLRDRWMRTEACFTVILWKENSRVEMYFVMIVDIVDRAWHREE